mgnify:CR=1 FL=1
MQSPSLTTVPVLSGRGCPYRCSYCANTTLLDLHGIKSGFLRKFDPEALVEDLVRLRDRWAVDFFQFWDEEFLYDMRYARDLLGRYRDRVARPFSMFVRVENMTDELCGLAAASGCHSMWFGVESGSERYRREHLGRRMSNEVILAAAERAKCTILLPTDAVAPNQARLPEYAPRSMLSPTSRSVIWSMPEVGVSREPRWRTLVLLATALGLASISL